jgi:hypothetical protein
VIAPVQRVAVPRTVRAVCISHSRRARSVRIGMAMRRAIMPSAPYCRRGFSIARRTPRTGPFDHFHGLRALRVSLDARAGSGCVAHRRRRAGRGAQTASRIARDTAPRGVSAADGCPRPVPLSHGPPMPCCPTGRGSSSLGAKRPASSPTRSRGRAARRESSTCQACRITERCRSAFRGARLRLVGSFTPSACPGRFRRCWPSLCPEPR